ncbi:hypothetical protein, partial [Saccharomonospora xinjiangensis]|uniref:hypothetical protein n=1 Tax=Saccharomonospora xinjiangensis TaxID=75294 RepID=UPI00350F02F1
MEPIRAEDITVYSDSYHDLHNLFQRLSDGMREAVGKSKAEWEGGAADSAHGYFTTLSDWSDGNSQNARMASDIIAAESEAAVRAKNSMPEPIPFNMDQEMANWGSDPFSLHEQVERTIVKQQESQAAHDEAVRVMTQYDFDLQESGNKQPVFAEPPQFGGSGGSGDGGASGVIRFDESTSASGFAGGPAGIAGGGASSVPSGTGSVGVLPGGGSGTGLSGGGSGTGPSGGSFTPIAPGPTTGSGVRPGTTRPSGLQPAGWRPPALGGRNNTSGPNAFGPGGNPGIGPMPMGPGFGPGGGPGGGAGGGSYSGRLPGGGFGPGGGAGAGPGAGAGAGAATGAKPMGGP